MRTKTKTCARCGGPFRYTNGNQKRCPECRIAHVREYSRQYMRDHYRERAEVRTRVVLGPCPCSGCGVPLYWNGYAWVEKFGETHAHVTMAAA